MSKRAYYSEYKEATLFDPKQAKYIKLHLIIVEKKLENKQKDKTKILTK